MGSAAEDLDPASLTVSSIPAAVFVIDCGTDSNCSRFEEAVVHEIINKSESRLCTIFEGCNVRLEGDS